LLVGLHLYHPRFVETGVGLNSRQQRKHYWRFYFWFQFELSASTSTALGSSPSDFHLLDKIFNAALVSKSRKSITSVRLKSNGGTMVVTRKATMPGYNKDVWFSTIAITNIITLSNLIQQYRVTYDSDDKMFVVHQESQGKPNMEFRMHKCGLHY
jgi:hypothetical protein